MKAECCRPEFLEIRADPVADYADVYWKLPPGASPLQRMLHADLNFYLPSDMLVKVDRMSMAHGLEVRVPFLDRELVEFCMGLPDHLLADLPWPSRNKLILRDWLARKMRPAISSRKKRGFTSQSRKRFAIAWINVSATFSRIPHSATTAPSIPIDF